MAKILYISNLDGDRIVGMINEHVDDHYIPEMAVDGAYHRRGIATELMNRMVCELKLRGVGKITLKSLPHGLPFYLKYGFVPTDKTVGILIQFDKLSSAWYIFNIINREGGKTRRAERVCSRYDYLSRKTRSRLWRWAFAVVFIDSGINI